MDGVFLAKAGIVTEMVSFLLIAPEILGKERLGGWERSLEKALPRVKKSADFREAGYPEATWRLHVIVLLVPLLALHVLFWTNDLWFVVGVTSGALLIWTVTGAILTFIDEEGNLVPTWVGIPLVVPLLISAVAAGVVLVPVLSLSIRALAGEDRLRVVIFGVGVVLLFGGLILQYLSV